jgi:tetratricopeptide (TPR) repeat protein
MDAVQLYRAGKYAEAAAAFETLAADDAAAASHLTNAATCKMELGLYRGALKQADAAIALQPHHLRAHLVRGLALRALKKPAKAAKAFQAGVDAATAGSDVVVLRELEQLLTDDAPPPPKPSVARGPRSPQADLAMVVAAAPVREPSKEAERWVDKGVPQDVLAQARGAVEHRTGRDDVDDAIATGYLLVNTNRLDQAIAAFDDLLSKHPRLVAARLGRGSARALQDDLQGALEDFDVAVEVAPHVTDCLKRRGQSLAALGRLNDALRDLSAAVALEEKSSSNEFDADLYHQRGAVHHRLQDYRTAAQDFALALERDAEGSQRPRQEAARTWNMLGLCEAQLGLVAHESFVKSLELDATSRETWLNLGQASRDRGDADAAKRAFMRCLATDPSFCRGHHAFGLLAYGTGDFAEAQRHFDACVARGTDEDADAITGALHYAGLCWSALGVFEKAEEYFVRALKRDAEHVCWYARQLAMYYGATLDDATADAERDILGVFKEGHCKRHAIALVAAAAPRKGKCRSSTKDVKAATRKWVAASYEFGGLVQLQNCPGFLPNARHHRMFGLMVLHAAYVAKSAFDGNAVKWREVYEVVVRWRREAEPGDAVWWIDGLPEKAFAEGFGLHTPMQSGQLRVVRYAKYIPDALEVVKETLRRNVPPGEDDFMERINEASSLEDVHEFCGRRDFWCTAPCASEMNGEDLGGTRITLQATKHGGFDFSIRTPGTPKRWKLYDSELQYHFEKLISEVPDKQKVRERAAKMFYYWCAFGPLSRGSACCGYAVLFGTLLAADCGVPSSLPSERQIDWEAILAPTAASFLDGVRPWLADSVEAALPDLPPPDEAFSTLRDRLGALLV